MSTTTRPSPLRVASPATFKGWLTRHQLIAFFVLSYLLLYAAIYLSMWFKIPYFYGPWFVSAFSPTIAAFLLAAVCGGMPAVKQLALGYTRWKVAFKWYFGALLLLLLPLSVALIYRGLGNPVPGLAQGATVASLLGQFVFNFFSGPFSEEAGWRGFALPKLQGRFNAFVSSLILGVVWTCWHIPLWFHPETKDRIPFLAFFALTLVLTTYMTWLYNNTGGSLVITILAHLSFNMVGAFVTGTLGLMPMNIFLMVGVPGLTLMFIWVLVYFGPKYLSRKPVDALPFTPKA